MSRVDDIIEGLDQNLRVLAKRLRTITKIALPKATESVKWGAPVYSINGKNVACLMVYEDHINLGFFFGAKLNSKLLEGTGKGMRHIKVRSPADIKEKEFTDVLKQAGKVVS